MPKEFPTELLNKYYAMGVELCDVDGDESDVEVIREGRK